MADSRDDRLAAGSGGTGNTLRIKDPQILLAAAAAGHKDQIGSRVAVKPPDPLGDASFGLNACTLTGRAAALPLASGGG